MRFFCAVAHNFEARKRYISAAAVAMLHLLIVLALADFAIAPSRNEGIGPELRVSLVQASQRTTPRASPMPEPELQNIVSSEPEPPQIDIEDKPAAATSRGLADILPPRPDPVSPNRNPSLPETFYGKSCQVTLSVLVDAAGRIADDEVTRSCGEPTLDRLAASYAKANWLFRPAMQGGKAIPDRATVVVQFASGK